MASEKSFEEIVEIANSLDVLFANLREDAENRYQLYSLRRIPELPEDIAREGQVNILSPLVINAAHTIRADLMMNPTEFLVTPLAREAGGGIPKGDSKKADNLEKSLAVIWSKLNYGRRIDRDIIWHQLVSPFGVMILECHDIDIPEQPPGMSDELYAELVERHKRMLMPWSVITPDPLTCAFLERDGQPTVFVRRYKQLVRDVRLTYSRRPGTEWADMDLDIINDHWQWTKASDDYSRFTTRTASTDMREVEMIWLDDGIYIYHVALDLENRKTGEVVWCGKNPLGRVSAFLVFSSLTPLRNPEDRYEPYLWPLMQTVDQLNYIRSLRATASRNTSGPDNYIPLDPELVKLYELANKPLPRAHRWRRNETPYLLGEIKERPVHVDPDLDKLEAALTHDLQKFLPSPFVNILDPAVLKASTASAILHAAEAGLRLYGPLMSAYDAAIKQLMEGLIYSVQYHYKDEIFYNYATGEEVSRGVNLKEGSVYTISSSEVDFPFLLNVKTRSMTQAQAAAQYELALKQWLLPDGSKGPATFDDIIDAANYSDKEAQKERLATERILNAIDPWIQQMALAEAIVEIEHQTGIKLPIGGEPPMQQGPLRMPNSAQRMDAPLVVGPEGGTESVVNG